MIKNTYIVEFFNSDSGSWVPLRRKDISFSTEQDAFNYIDSWFPTSKGQYRVVLTSKTLMCHKVIDRDTTETLKAEVNELKAVIANLKEMLKDV